MTHTLVLLRHSKADRPSGVPDPQRPLTDRGRSDAAAAGSWLAEHRYLPDVVLCSPSRRTRETWFGVAVGLPEAAEVHYADEIYSGGPEDVIDLLRKQPENVGTALVIGHNPTLEELARLLDPDGAQRLRTSGLSVHEVPAGWAGLATGGAPVTRLHTARG